jgi:hypothetical protein
MPLARRAQLTALLGITMFGSACASMRGVSVGSDSASTYAVEVSNTMPHAMNITWSDGGDEKALGSVGSGRVERFIVAGAKSTQITVLARDANRTHSRSIPVTLVAGSTQRVTVR